MNKELVNYLNQFADYYIISQDSPRVRAFRSAARNIELLNFEITSDNLSKVQFKGLGKSIIEEIENFIKQKQSNRLEQLKTKYPPIQCLELLTLYNFDFPFILKLWEQYNVYKVSQLYRLTDHRVQKALEIVQKINTSVDVKKFPCEYPLLGDCLVHTNYGTGVSSVSDIVAKLKDYQDKHIFIADKLSSPSVLSGITSEMFYNQKKDIIKAQIDYNVKIFHGIIIDIDLDGNLLDPAELINKAEFIVLKISTNPHTNILERLEKVLEKFTLDNIMIDCLDIYSLLLDKDKFQNIIDRFDPIILVKGKDDITNTNVIKFLQQIKLTRVAIASDADSFDQFKTMEQVCSYLSELKLDNKNIINCLPRPFKKGIITKNKIGVRIKTEKIEQKIERLKKLTSIITGEFK